MSVIVCGAREIGNGNVCDIHECAVGVALRRDLMAIVSALEYNTFFRGLKVTHARLSHETLERILHVVRRSLWLEELHLEALGLRADFVHKLAVAVISNSNPALQNINFSHNLIEDKGMGFYM